VNCSVVFAQNTQDFECHPFHAEHVHHVPAACDDARRSSMIRGPRSSSRKRPAACGNKAVRCPLEAACLDALAAPKSELVAVLPGTANLIQPSRKRIDVTRRDGVSSLALDDEIGRGGYARSRHTGQARGERLVDDQAPALARAWHHHAIRRDKRSGQLRLVQETSPAQSHSEARRFRACFASERTVSCHHQQGARSEARNGANSIDWSLARLEFAREEHNEVPMASADCLPQSCAIVLVAQTLGLRCESLVVHTVR
jgi:hypothetical protein